MAILFFAPLFFQSCDVEKVFVETGGILVAEAENFGRQERIGVRQWQLRDDVGVDSSSGASQGKYLKLLPDTRTVHEDPLVPGENFTEVPGEMAVLTYKTYFNNPGKYYVWVRTRTHGTEDNGIHVGIDGTWPESGRRMQFDASTDEWYWDSKQRTELVHTGIEKLIYLQVESKGEHDISFSMREDGFEFDKWAMTREYERPVGLGPKEMPQSITNR